jgi:S-(hydroxymethyl)mycothiol dehydrogenase
MTVPDTAMGVIARTKNAAAELVEIIVPQPTGHDVVVRVQACGVCHTDLTYRDGGINDEFPFLLGHEAAGIVEAVGDNVRHVQVGDFVVLNWRAVRASAAARSTASTRSTRRRR